MTHAKNSFIFYLAIRVQILSDCVVNLFVLYRLCGSIELYWLKLDQAQIR